MNKENLGIIYVISEAKFAQEVTKENILSGQGLTYEPCLKIGYTTNIEKRFVFYTSDSPRVDLLFKIDSATEEDERRLHKLFEKFRRDDLNGVEWFVWSEEIIKFFQDNKDIDSIRKHLPSLIKLKNNRSKFYLESIINPILWIIFDCGIFPDITKIEELHEMIYDSEFIPSDQEDFLVYLESILTEEQVERVKSEYNIYINEVLPKIEPILKEFDSISYYHSKMSFLCQKVPELDDKFSIGLLNSVPSSFKNYYTVLGPKRCSAACFRKADMEREYQRLVSNQGIDLSSEIYLVFEIGKIYLKSFIKEKLKEIYEKLGYKSTPKAIDILNYFEVKPCKISNPITGKRDHGYELISKK